MSETLSVKKARLDATAILELKTLIEAHYGTGWGQATDSLNVAMDLAAKAKPGWFREISEGPRGWMGAVSEPSPHNNSRWFHNAYAQTPALALCAAVMRFQP